jgi:hypothetical protein
MASDELERIWAAKEARRRRLARLPIEEKIAILVRLQELAAPILAQRGKVVRVWRLPKTPRN